MRFDWSAGGGDMPDRMQGCNIRCVAAPLLCKQRAAVIGGTQPRIQPVDAKRQVLDI